MNDVTLMKDTIISYDLENISSEGAEAIVAYKNRIASKATINIYGETGKIIITYSFKKNIISVQEEIISYAPLLNEDSLMVIPISKISYFIDYKGHLKGEKGISYTDIFKNFIEIVPLNI
uniref:PH domain-containing protein n=4 Tax=unclassified Prevotella TaxID=2638335 RepID=A0AB33JL85_9BACT